jgi:hypothetical protein
VGATIILSFCIVPKSTVTVHDMVKNRFVEIYSVPTALAFIAWSTNNIENGLKDIVAGAAGPMNDPIIVGKGEGIELLSNMDDFPQIVKDLNPQLVQSLRRYITDCIRLELSLGDQISLDSLSRTDNLWNTMRSRHPSVFTVVYNRDGSETLYSCQAAYTVLDTELNIVAGMAATSFCQKRGYEPASVGKCRGDLEFFMENYIVNPIGGAITAANAIINITVADA